MLCEDACSDLRSMEQSFWPGKDTKAMTPSDWSGLGALGERLDLRLSNHSLLHRRLQARSQPSPFGKRPDLGGQGLHDELDLTFKDGLGFQIPVCCCRRFQFPSSG